MSTLSHQWAPVWRTSAISGFVKGAPSQPPPPPQPPRAFSMSPIPIPSLPFSKSPAPAARVQPRRAFMDDDDDDDDDYADVPLAPAPTPPSRPQLPPPMSAAGAAHAAAGAAHAVAGAAVGFPMRPGVQQPPVAPLRSPAQPVGAGTAAAVAAAYHDVSSLTIQLVSQKTRAEVAEERLRKEQDASKKLSAELVRARADVEKSQLELNKALRTMASLQETVEKMHTLLSSTKAALEASELHSTPKKQVPQASPKAPAAAVKPLQSPVAQPATTIIPSKKLSPAPALAPVSSMVVVASMPLSPAPAAQAATILVSKPTPAPVMKPMPTPPLVILPSMPLSSSKLPPSQPPPSNPSFVRAPSSDALAPKKVAPPMKTATASAPPLSVTQQPKVIGPPSQLTPQMDFVRQLLLHFGVCLQFWPYDMSRWNVSVCIRNSMAYMPTEIRSKFRYLLAYSEPTIGVTKVSEKTMVEIISEVDTFFAHHFSSAQKLCKDLKDVRLISEPMKRRRAASARAEPTAAVETKKRRGAAAKKAPAKASKMSSKAASKTSAKAQKAAPKKAKAKHAPKTAAGKKAPSQKRGAH
jgi:hypothetical protein